MNQNKTLRIPEMFMRAKMSKRCIEESAGPDMKRPKDSDEKENTAVHSFPTVSEDTTKPFSLKTLLRDKPWMEHLHGELSKPYAQNIENFLSAQYAKGTKIFPPRNEIFSAFDTALNNIRIVIIGQDPYHNDGQAHGLSFSVKVGVRPPPSLLNIFKELEVDIPGFKRPSHGCLTGWAKQGVFLLNASLTVKAHEANSHAQIGWQKFTDGVISIISKESAKPVVFLLWGGFAHKKEALIDKKKHAVIKTAHPSPLSAQKWFGCRCFSKANECLTHNNRKPIDWCAL